jgi:hypothetical protein
MFPPKAQERIRVLLVGDSNVEAAALPFSEMPEIHLEQFLNQAFGDQFFSVRSVAASGWGQDQQLLGLKRYYKDFGADYIILWHTPRNDFWENAFPDRSVTTNLGPLKPTFVLGSGGLIEFNFDPYRARFLAHSHLYQLAVRKLGFREQLLADFYKLIPAPEGHGNAPRGKCPGTIVDQDAYNLDRAKYGLTPVSIETREAFLESRSHFSPFLKQMSERDKYLTRVTQALFDEIASLAKANGTELIVFFVNNSFRDGRSDFAPPGSCVVRSENFYEVGDLPERVRDILAGFNLVQLDSTHHDISLDEVAVARSDRHLNKLGNQLVFNELVASLKKRGLVRPVRSPQGGIRP